MPDGPDIDRAVQRDLRKVKQLRGGPSRPSIPAVIEGVCWGLTALSILGMLVVMPFVGAEKAISGSVWLGYSGVSIAVFGGLALVMRAASMGLAEQVDRSMDQRFNQ